MYNLLVQAVMGYRWLHENCHNLPLLIKIDDDVLLDVPKFFHSYRTDLNPTNKPRSILCNVWEKAKVMRTGKWKIEKSLFHNESYEFPYCSGYLVVVTPDLVSHMYRSGKGMDFFWVDDVFMYGLVPANITGVHFVNLGGYGVNGKHVITNRQNIYEKCLSDHGANCTQWAALTQSDKDFQKLHTQMRLLYTRNSTKSKT